MIDFDIDRFTERSGCLAGKSSQNDTWLPLTVHSIDTAGIMLHLIRDWLPDNSVHVLSCDLTEEELYSLAAFVALTHDIGKITTGFQRKVTQNDEAIQKRLSANDLVFTEDKGEKPHAEAGEAILITSGCPARVAAVIGAHHGKPTGVDCIDEDEAEQKVKRGIGDSAANKRAVWQSVRQEFASAALALAGYTDYKSIPAINFQTQVLLTGTLIMADWLASNTEYFPLIPIGECRAEPRARLEIAWEKIHMPDKWLPDIYTYTEERFDRDFGFRPNAVQRTILEAASSAATPGIYILEAQMGVGKTEAALSAASILATRFGAGGLYFGLPTQATADGLFPRIKSWASGPKDRQHTMMLAHNAAQLNPEFVEMENNSGNVATEGLFVHEWFRGTKKKLLSDFVVATVDQLLMLALRQKHVMLRHLGLSGKVVVIDECHAYDAYMNEYLFRALEWLASYNVPVMLLSATLPADKRNDMLRAYLRGRGVYEMPAFGKTDAYPLLTWTDGNDVHQRSIPVETKHVKIHIDSKSFESAIRDMRNMHEDGASIGILCNTIRKAQDVYEMVQQIYPGSEVMLCHAQFIMEDRAEWEKQLMDRLGKASREEQRKGFIVIGTQVLEQSLDIDFDYMITELCPMDLLMQRIGRLHRHERQRPESVQQARCTVITYTEDEDKANEAIYGKWLLKRTWKYLPSEMSLPDDISPLVQQTYDATLQDDGMTDDLQAYKKLNADKKNRAHAYLLKSPEDDRKYMAYTSPLNGMLDAEAGKVEGEACTRDGILSVDVIALIRHIDGKISFFPWISDLQMDPEKIPDAELVTRIARQKVKLPSAMTQPWNIETTTAEIAQQDQVPSGWRENKLIGNSLYLFFNEDCNAIVGQYHLHYSRIKGLEYKRTEE